MPKYERKMHTTNTTLRTLSSNERNGIRYRHENRNWAQVCIGTANFLVFLIFPATNTLTI